MIERVGWLVLALIHAVPALALVRPSMIERLYGVAAGGDVHLLLHHRAALFAAVLAACLWAAFDPAARRLAVVVVGISMVGFLALYALGGAPEGLRGIAIADAIGLVPFAYVAYRTFAG